jgi:hypothetical protein
MTRSAMFWAIASIGGTSRPPAERTEPSGSTSSSIDAIPPPWPPTSEARDTGAQRVPGYLKRAGGSATRSARRASTTHEPVHEQLTSCVSPAAGAAGQGSLPACAPSGPTGHARAGQPTHDRTGRVRADGVATDPQPWSHWAAVLKSPLRTLSTSLSRIVPAGRVAHITPRESYRSGSGPFLPSMNR